MNKYLLRYQLGKYILNNFEELPAFVGKEIKKQCTDYADLGSGWVKNPKDKYIMHTLNFKDKEITKTICK